MEFYFLNDKSEYNYNYRSGLIEVLESRGLKFKSVGLLDSTFSFFYYIFSLAFLNREFISSNIKSNIFFMLFFWRKGTVIVNGMGRKRKSRLFRFFIGFLFKINSRKKIIFQNYADYRYFTYLLRGGYFWVPGSGGNKRSLGNKGNIVIVSRDSKLPLIANSIAGAFNLVDKKSKVVFVGCTNSVVEEYFVEKQVFGTGYLPQKEIFSYGYRFFQPSGYGEGIPHTLVDAICSGMKIYIYKSDYIKFGLHKLGFEYIQVEGSVLELIYSEIESNTVEEKKISLQYLQFVDGFIV